MGRCATLGGAEALAHILKDPAVAESCVAHMVDDPRRRRQHVSAPQGHSPVVQAARRPVIGRPQVSGDAVAEIHRSIPVAGLDRDIRMAGANDRIVAERRHEVRPVAPPQAIEAGQIEMVIMIVRQQHRVDRRQVRERDARRIDPPGPGEIERTGALGKDRIDQNVAVSHLDQKGRMADQRGPQIRRRGGRFVGERAGIGLRP